MGKSKNGKRIIIFTIVVILAFDICVIALTANSAGGIFKGIVRFILECILLSFLYKGKKWAKWLTSILLLLSGITSLFSLFFGFGITIIGGIIFFLLGIVMISSKDVAEYFNQIDPAKVQSAENDYRISLYSENCDIFAVRKDCTSKAKVEFFDKNKTPIINQTCPNHSIVQIHLNQSVSEVDFQYGADTAGALAFIDLQRNGRWIRVISRLSNADINMIYSDLLYDYEIVCYDYNYKILFNEYLHFYDLDISELNPIKIEFNELGILNKIAFPLHGENIFFEDLEDEIIAELRGEIIAKMYGLISSEAKVFSVKKAPLFFVGIEYFFDGNSYDIGVRFGGQSKTDNVVIYRDEKLNKEEDIESYFRMLDLENIIKTSTQLFQFLLRKDLILETNTAFEMLEGIANEIFLKISQADDWKNGVEFEPDFILIEPVLYD